MDAVGRQTGLDAYQNYERKQCNVNGPPPRASSPNAIGTCEDGSLLEPGGVCGSTGLFGPPTAAQRYAASLRADADLPAAALRTDEAASGYGLQLRIDVPGDSPDPAKYDYRDGFSDFGHVAVSLRSPSSEETVGFYPSRSPHPFDNPSVGIPGVVKDDAQHEYEYEATFELTQDEFRAAQAYVEQVKAEPPAWSADYWCADFALQAAEVAGVEIDAEPKTEYVGLGGGNVTGIYPGDLAKQLHESGIGAPVTQAGDAGSSGGSVK